MVYFIIILMVAAIIAEGVALRTVIKRYHKEQFKVKLLEGIIEERFMNHGKNIDRGQYRHGNQSDGAIHKQ